MERTVKLFKIETGNPEFIGLPPSLLKQFIASLYWAVCWKKKPDWVRLVTEIKGPKLY